MAVHFCHCVQRFWSNHSQVRYLVQCQAAGWYFIFCTKQVTVFVSPIFFLGKRLTFTAFKRIFSQRYYMVTQIAAYFSIFNTTTQLVAIKFFDKSLYGDIAHRSHVGTINRITVKSRLSSITISISGSIQGPTAFFNTILSLFVFQFHSDKLFKVATRLHISAKLLQHTSGWLNSCSS